MNKFSSIVLSAIIIVVFSACRDKEDDKDEQTEVPANGTIKIGITTKWQNDLYNNTAVVSDNYGNQLRIDNFVSYVSTLSLLKADGSALLLKDYSLINFAQANLLEFSVPKGDYIGIRFLLGVPSDVNTDTDPAQYPNSHVLSVAGSQGMFWNWNTGYIFTKLEGKADTSGTNQPLLYSFAYHTGDDHFTKLVTLDKDITINGGVTQNEQITLQVDKIFSPDSGTEIDLSQDQSFHSPGPLMSAFVNNFGNAFSIE